MRPDNRANPAIRSERCAQAPCLRVRALPGSRTRGRLTFGTLDVPCALGRSGLTRRKREGDGATPMGSFALLRAYFRADRQPRPESNLPLRALRPDDGWCDDAHDGRYNMHVTLPFNPSHECLWRSDRLYDVIVVLDYNLRPRVRGGGSAIFFHVAREGFAPTEGCVAVAPDAMRRILARIGPGMTMRIG
ncbi:L,D-transpeptidase family protein [Breoghania sp. L-A4]|uniref:L,D-transpeptidase family protein n=1 Tax=Breoghania sp. L-A4 TaxID=2304600 RepID=UPI000E35EF61|nr:L,D-transpeptidase family protein [Breoghania sp. L-A4]AXS42262.1 hypothetical protein D1F64_22570 [Breoghania sp. L-A4]